MQYTEKDILYEYGKYFVLKSETGGFDVWRSGVSYATRCAQIGWFDGQGLERAKAEISRRVLADIKVTPIMSPAEDAAYKEGLRYRFLTRMREFGK